MLTLLEPIARRVQTGIVPAMQSLRALSMPGLILMVALTAFTIGLRALIPVGYMPDLAGLASGQIEMVVCTMNGPIKMLVDPGHDPHPVHPSDRQSDTCQFALATPWSAAVTVDATDLLYVLAIVGTIVFAVAATRAWHRQAYQLAQPRGPPLFSL